MQYLLTLYADEAGWSHMSKSEQETADCWIAFQTDGDLVGMPGALVRTNISQ